VRKKKTMVSWHISNFFNFPSTTSRPAALEFAQLTYGNRAKKKLKKENNVIFRFCCRWDPRGKAGLCCGQKPRLPRKPGPPGT